MQAIASSGVSYIRTTFTLSVGKPIPAVMCALHGICVGLMLPRLMLKVVGILAPNWHYRDKYDPLAMSNLAAWIAQTGLVTAFEVTNEPNNDYASYEGPTCETKLVPLTNVVTAAVHAVNPSIQVNGLERAGSANFQHAGKGNHDEWCGLSPYANGNYIPETTYEWQYLGYGSWIQALDSETSLPKWENRMGGSAPRQRLPTRIRLNLSRGGYCKRLVSPWIIRSSTNFADKGTELYGVFSMNRMRSKTAFYVVQRIISA